MITQKRSSAFLALLLYLVALLPSAAGAIVLCRGLDGHVELESDSFAASVIVSSIDVLKISEDVAKTGELNPHHAIPCQDERVRYLQGRRGEKTTASTHSSHPQSTFAVEHASQLTTPIRLDMVWSHCEHQGLSSTLRCLRTVKLLN